MKECEILGVKIYMDPSYIFSGGKTSQPPGGARIYAPASAVLNRNKKHSESANLGQGRPFSIHPSSIVHTVVIVYFIVT